MRRLAVSVPVRAPCGFTLAYVATYFNERKLGPDPADLRLSWPLHTFVGDASIDASVNVELRYLPERGAHNALSIAWVPKGNAAFPCFQGVFEAKREGDARCRFALSGSYIAPGGISDAVFDAVVGHRIARTTIETLLRRIGDAAQSDYRIRLAL